MKRDTDLETLIKKGRPYEAISPQLATLATAFEYDAPVIVPEKEQWTIPAGAFTKCQGG